MKCELIIKKGNEVKNGIIDVQVSMEKIAVAFKAQGWQIIYFEPISKLQDDEDTLFINIGEKRNANPL